MSGPNEFSEFYSRLKNIKEFYRKHPNEISVPMAVEFDEFFKIRDNPNEINLVDFTDEEGYGKFLDLNHCFEKYLNLRGVDRIDYLSYLSLFDQLFDVPKDRKLNADYVRYLETLLEYLQDYCSRVKPLLSLPTVSQFDTHFYSIIKPIICVHLTDNGESVGRL
jgi:splicing factor 3A subunit 3